MPTMQSGAVLRPVDTDVSYDPDRASATAGIALYHKMEEDPLPYINEVTINSVLQSPYGTEVGNGGPQTGGPTGFYYGGGDGSQRTGLFDVTSAADNMFQLSSCLSVGGAATFEMIIDGSSLKTAGAGSNMVDFWDGGNIHTWRIWSLSGNGDVVIRLVSESSGAGQTSGFTIGLIYTSTTSGHLFDAVFEHFPNAEVPTDGWFGLEITYDDPDWYCRIDGSLTDSFTEHANPTGNVQNWIGTAGFLSSQPHAEGLAMDHTDFAGWWGVALHDFLAPSEGGKAQERSRPVIGVPSPALHKDASCGLIERPTTQQVIEVNGRP